MKNNKGVTLVSLMITIVVLLILASVAVTSGTSAVDYIKFTNVKSQFQVMQAEVTSWSQEYKEAEDQDTWLTENIGASADIAVDDSDSTAIATLSEGAGTSDTDGYIYLSADYIQNNLDIDGVDNGFLVNLEDNILLIYSGFTYQDTTYYCAEDFGINVVTVDDMSGTITFDTVQESGSLIIYNIETPINMSKYTIQYQIDDGNWVTLTSDMKSTYSNTEAWYITLTQTGTYNIKITSASEDISGSATITVSSI